MFNPADGSLEVSPEVAVETEQGKLHVRYASGFGGAGVIARYEKSVESPVLVRIQSSCVFSESLGAIDCDCSDQLNLALHTIAARGGYLIYSYEEGRGAGLASKIQAMKLQAEEQIDTAEAFRRLGLPADPRRYRFAAEAIRVVVGNSTIRLLTNNPKKVDALRRLGISVVGSSRLIVAKNHLVRDYLREKAQSLGHTVDPI
jgi:GTP cyclohydrolase II